MTSSFFSGIDGWHWGLITLSLGLFILLRFAQVARFQADYYNMILETEIKKLFLVLKHPQPFTRDDLGKEFVIRSVIDNGVVVFAGESGDVDNLRFIPLDNEEMVKQDIHPGQNRVFQGLFNEKGECEIPTLLPSEITV
jgi:hypothetical protein